MTIEIKSNIKEDDLLFPISKAWKTEHIPVGDGHSLFVQQFGKKDGPPVLLVHGGPGCGIILAARDSRFHDPSFFRIIAVDQRGCGLSKPHVADDRKKAFHQNTPDKLAADFETVREHLGIDRWHVSGYSWGSCLSVYYSSLFPKSVLSLTVGAVWMHTPEEIDWYINRMGLFFPEAEADLLKILPKSIKRFDRLDTLYKSVMGKDQRYALKVAEAQGRFEDIACYFESPEILKNWETKKKQTASEKRRDKRDMTAIGALEIYFMKQHPMAAGWYKTAKTQKALQQIKNFTILQGRYDIVCPPTTAYELHQTHPHSTLTIAHYAGHRRAGAFLQACIKANERLKQL